MSDTAARLAAMLTGLRSDLALGSICCGIEVSSLQKKALVVHILCVTIPTGQQVWRSFETVGDAPWPWVDVQSTVDTGKVNAAI